MALHIVKKEPKNIELDAKVEWIISENYVFNTIKETTIPILQFNVNPADINELKEAYKNSFNQIITLNYYSILIPLISSPVSSDDNLNIVTKIIKELLKNNEVDVYLLLKDKKFDLDKGEYNSIQTYLTNEYIDESLINYSINLEPISKVSKVKSLNQYDNITSYDSIYNFDSLETTFSEHLL